MDRRPLSSSQRTWLLAELKVWQARGFVQAEQVEGILDLYELPQESAARQHSLALFALQGIAVFFIGLAVLLLTGTAGGAFSKAFHYFQFKQEEYMQHYHNRSNVENTFSAIKRKFGARVASKNEIAMVKEVLCKILCHNLTSLIQEQELLGIVPGFWKDEEPEERQNGARMILRLTRPVY